MAGNLKYNLNPNLQTEIHYVKAKLVECNKTF